MTAEIFKEQTKKRNSSKEDKKKYEELNKIVKVRVDLSNKDQISNGVCRLVCNVFVYIKSSK